MEIGVHRLHLKGADQLSDDVLKDRLIKADDERLFLVAEAFRRGWQQQEIQDLTKIDWWFLDKVEGIIKFEAIIAGESELTYETLYRY